MSKSVHFNVETFQSIVTCGPAALGGIYVPVFCAVCSVALTILCIVLKIVVSAKTVDLKITDREVERRAKVRVSKSTISCMICNVYYYNIARTTRVTNTVDNHLCGNCICSHTKRMSLHSDLVAIRYME
jgi:hypothetical protein